MIRWSSWRLLTPIGSFLRRRRRVGVFVRRTLDRFPRLEDALLAVARGDPQKHYEAWVAAYDTIDDRDLAAMSDEQSAFPERPLLSLVVPVAGATAETLDALERSLSEQVYDHFEVWLVGDAPQEQAPATADAWNQALEAAAGEFAILVDPAVSLRPHALFLLARTIVDRPDALLVYADEDTIDERGRRSGHYFKPDWNEALLRSQNYLGGLVCFSRAHALASGGCREELDGDCAWGLFLRMTAGAPPGSIHHLPFVLTHRPERQAGGETHRQRVARAHEQRLARLGNRARVEPVGESSHSIRYVLPDEPPSVSLIIASTGQPKILGRCLDSLERTSYPDFEVLLAVSERHAASVPARPRIRLLVYDDRPFNFSWVNNWAAAQTRSELLCFLNDDTEAITPDWLSAMVGQILHDRVGALGARLLFPNDRTQHAGVLVGPGGIAAHAYRGRRRETLGYHDRAVVDQDVSCVTAACMLIRRDAFDEVGGFDDALAVAFNDVDLCLRLREAGWRIVWTPGAELYHRESTSLGRHDAPAREEEWDRASELMLRRWSETLASDPHYSPNLSLDLARLWEPAFPPRVAHPWRAAARELQAEPSSPKRAAPERALSP